MNLEPHGKGQLYLFSESSIIIKEFIIVDSNFKYFKYFIGNFSKGRLNG